MERVTKFFMARPTLFWSLMIGILLMGVLSYLKMPKLEGPAVPIKQVSIVAIYPGADAHNVELNVVRPIEDAMRTLPDVYKIRSDVNPGRAIINVEFAKETPTSELEQHFDLVRRKASDVALKLPQGCMAPIVIDDMMDVYGLMYTISGDGYDLAEVEKYAKFLRRELLTVPGVKRINIGGVPSEVITIEFTPEQIKRNGLMPTQIMLALKGATATVNGGTEKAGNTRLNVEVTEGVTSVDDIANLLIDTPEGKKVRLAEVAKVTRGVAIPTRNTFLINGQPALTFAITLENSAVVPDVGKAVDAKMNELKKELPVGFTIDKLFFQPDKVSEAMNGFMLNLLESVLIVVIVLLLSMGWRSGLIIGFGLVLTVALSFPILSAAGTTLQRISLGAFIVAMGMLVDNSVVIMDGILVDRSKGLPRTTYLYRIGQNTALPLLGATVIAACTFLPIFLTPGSVGEFAGDLFMVICVSLLVSWVLALIQVPICADKWLGKASPKQVQTLEQAYPEGRFYRGFRKLLQWLIGHRAISLTVAVFLLLLSTFGMTRVRTIFFPDFNYGQFVVECYFPGANDPDSVRASALAMADSVAKMAAVDRVAVSTGGAPARYCFMRPMPTGGDSYAELIVDTKDFDTMQEMCAKVRNYLRKTEPTAYVRTRKYNFSISSSHTVEVEFSGPDPAVLRRLSAEAERIMRDCPLVDPYSVQNNWQPRAPRVVYEFSQQDASRAGISREDVGHALQAAGDGYAVGVITEGDKTIPIQITMRTPQGERISDLANIPVWSTANINIDATQLPGLATGASSPNQIQERMFTTSLLGNVVDTISLRFSEDYIYRFNGRRTIQAECDPDPANPDATPSKVEKAIREKVDAIQLPEGYSMRFVGEGEMSNEATGIVLGFLPVILMIVFLVLLLLFNNWKKLFIILLCFPFVMCGIVPLLLLTQTPFTFIAILGFMGLIGMMVKNAIVLVDEINRLTTVEQVAAYEAVIRATLSRVRPVMLASFTTILGMIPLMGDAMYGSLAVTVIGGLFVGTLITLLLLPLLYSILFKIKRNA